MGALIDLGELTPTATAPPAPLRRRRRTGLAVVALAVALSAAGGAVPVEPVHRLYTVHALGNAPVMLTADRMYTIDGDGGVRRVTAYDARDGRRLWGAETTLRPGLAWNFVGLPGTVLLSNFTDDDGESMVAFDATTGAIRWTRVGQVLAAVPHLGAFLGVDAGGDSVWLADAATGVLRWRGPLGDGCGWVFDRDEDPRRIVRICGDGVLSSIDVSDGRRLAARAIGAAPPGSGSGFAGHDLIVTAGLAVVTTFDGASLSWQMAAYGVDDLAPRWFGRILPADQVVLACPPDNLCVYGDTVAETISARTGAVLGPPPDRSPVQVVLPGHPDTDPPTVVLVPADSAFNNAGHEAVLYPREPGDSTVAPRWAHADRTRIIDAVAAGGGWHYRVIGQIAGISAARCVVYDGGPGGRRLACATAENRLTVWALPDAP